MFVLQLDDDQFTISHVSLSLFKESLIGSIGALEAIRKETKDEITLEDIDSQLEKANFTLETTNKMLLIYEHHIQKAFNNDIDITQIPEWEQQSQNQETT